jgi:hypothetical protein
VEQAGFTFHQIALTAMVAAVASYAVLRLAARELRERDDIAVAVLVGVATFGLRWLGNVPALNDDFLPVVSPNDCLGFPVALLAGLIYWMLWPLGGQRPGIGRAWRWDLLLGVIGFLVNVAII